MFSNDRLVVGVDNFSDAGVFRLRDDLLIVQSVDFFPPLVDDPFIFGQIAAANSMSDVFAMGGKPTTALNIVSFPDDELDLGILSDILKGGSECARHAGAVIIGGHTVRDTEIKYGQAVTGVVSPNDLLTNQEATPGDVLILTKGLGTGYVTTAFKANKCPTATLDAAIASMVQLNHAGAQAAKNAGAHASTDVTGFGLAGHSTEMAQASNVTLVIELDQLPILPGVLALAESGHQTRATKTNQSHTAPLTRIEGQPSMVLLELIYDAQTSGGLLLSTPKKNADKLVKQAKIDGADAACVIGCVTEKQDVPLVING